MAPSSEFIVIIQEKPPFGRLRGNVHTSSVARWKARVRLPIRQN